MPACCQAVEPSWSDPLVDGGKDSKLESWGGFSWALCEWPLALVGLW